MAWVDENDSNSDIEEEAEERALENPSTNIRKALQRIFTKDGFKYIGSYYASESYPQAPNPQIRAEGVGMITLPLTGAAVKHLIAGCKQAPFGKGERTIVDKKVRDTWEMDASKITFTNPTWTKWINTVILPAVCEKLGVSINASKPRAELYKLLLYETGSHFLPHQDTAKTTGMFATIVVILPSQFTGGALELSHSGEHVTVDVSAMSSTSTHVVAWYTDVYHSVQPVESGYRLALSYNLVHSSVPSLKPSIRSNANTQELKHALLSWKARDSPTKLIYLMSHMYSYQELRRVSLKGKDAYFVANIRGVAKELGFRLCLVNLELHQSGPAIDFGDFDDYYYPIVRRRKRHELGEVEEESWSFDDAVDLYGNSVDLNEDITLDDKDEYFPRTLAKTVPAEEEYEGYMGNVRVSF
ncbi:hypothetical protein M408DRAFT_79639 [Serendipita vermifera MAFF 305830]|uniref:Prolyl 4-hydroxylase alpha subunit Fe(2+) 2OG dioxygenase domain-containing protein n=1 Tax=Serendipita vermifera MAFF 305830 TaxID=933852 RepID=A0A0C3ARU7_SERVB|nr:hypothetical protein M408DRAFT_79639 [Serendipita vermifera MAFF 305830]